MRLFEHQNSDTTLTNLLARRKKQKAKNKHAKVVELEKI
jgi:hypothetical protein